MNHSTAGGAAGGGSPDQHPDASLPGIVQALLTREGAGEMTWSEVLEGGHSDRTRRLHTASGKSYVIKEHFPVIPGRFAGEAAGLGALALPGCPRVVRVLAAADEALVLEDLGDSRTRRSTYWEDLGRGVARLHAHTHAQFGWPTDNYIGLVRQHNGWLEDGYEFFTTRRILPYLSLPRCEQALTAEDRRGIERFCARLPERIPPQPPSLLHGDLIAGNVLTGAEGEPVLIDPAVHYGWAEAELAIATLDEPFPETFFAAYTACRPLDEGWRERFPLYLLRERLYMLSQVGDRFGDVGRIRELIERYG